MIVSSRTPEGRPNRCPVCAAEFRIEPSHPASEAPCPNCGHLVWFPTFPATFPTVPVTVVRFSDAHEINKTDLLRLAQELKQPRLLLCLGDVRICSTVPIAALLALDRHVASAANGKLVLCECIQLEHILTTLRLTEVFEIYHDEREALAAFCE